MHGMQGRLISVRHLSAADERAWQALSARAVKPNPFYEPDCVIQAALHQAPGAEINLALAQEDGRFCAFLPFRPLRRWKFPYPILTSQVRRMGYLGTPLVDPDRGQEAIEIVLEALASQRGIDHARFFVLDTSGADGPVAGIVRDAADALHFPLSVFESFERGFLQRLLEPTYALDYHARTRHKWRQKRRHLCREIGAEVRIIDRAGDVGAVEEYIAMEASGYKHESGVAMATVAGEPAYFADMCHPFAVQGRLQFLSLEAGGRSEAMELLVKAGNGLALTALAYDEKFTSFSPGVLLETGALEHLHQATDFEWIDSGSSADNALLLWLYPERRRIEGVIIILGRNLVDRAVVRAFITARPMHRAWHERRVRSDARSAHRRQRSGS